MHGILPTTGLFRCANANWERSSRHLEDSILKAVEGGQGSGPGGHHHQRSRGKTSLTAAAGHLKKAVNASSGTGGGIKSVIKSIERYSLVPFRRHGSINRNTSFI